MNTEQELEKIFKTINTSQIKSMLENQAQTNLKIFHAFIPTRNEMDGQKDTKYFL